MQPFPATGAKWQISNGGASDPQWRRNGHELFYIAADGKLMTVPVKGGSSFEVGATQVLFQTKRPTTRGPVLFGNYASAAMVNASWSMRSRPKCQRSLLPGPQLDGRSQK